MWANCSFCALRFIAKKIRIDIYVLMSLGPAIHKGRPHSRGGMAKFLNKWGRISIKKCRKKYE